ncbi:MAG: N-acylneuraminate cytidylyltransferase [Candidatus Azotimanducaceae bacterium]|jgi:N-acylneuraminate cytidylyltransferase
MKDIVAIIPARSGSKGVANKNILPLGGKPLLAFSIAVAKKSSLIDRVIVSTDSEEYALIARQYGAEVPFLRPASISGDKATDAEFFAHLIHWFESNEPYVPEFFAHLRPTTPIRDFEVIDNALRGFVNSTYSALRSCHRMSESSYKSFEITDRKLKTICTGEFDIESANFNRQSFPETFEANGYIDIIRSELVRKRGIIHGEQVQAFVTERAYEIDEPIDVEFLEYLIQRNPEHLSSIFE